MNWIAPEITRVRAPLVAGERIMLEGWLDWYRATLLSKCTGLSGEQLAQHAVPPSNLSLTGLVRHIAEVERAWFRRRFCGEPVGYLYCSDEHPDADLEDVTPAVPNPPSAHSPARPNWPGRRSRARAGRDLLL